MGALPNVPNVIKLNIHWAVLGDPLADTILHFHYTSSPPDDADLGSFLTAVHTNVTSTLAPEYESGTQYVGSDVKDLSSPMGGRSTDATIIAGTRTGTRLAPATCALVNYAIRRSYRGGKPRSYWPFGVSGDVAATGFWADAFVTEYEEAVLTFVNNLIGTFGGFVVDNQCQVSYYGPPNKILTNPSTGRVRTVSTRRDAPGGTGEPLVDIIQNWTGSKIISSQRRRNRNA